VCAARRDEPTVTKVIMLLFATTTLQRFGDDDVVVDVWCTFAKESAATRTGADAAPSLSGATATVRH
jgi:hypothetical protein